MLLCSHFHQVDGDRAARKRSPAVRFGTARAAAGVAAAVVAVHALIAGGAVAGALPAAAAAASVAALPAGVALARRAAADHARPAAIRTLKLDALKWHTLVGVALAVGLAVG